MNLTDDFWIEAFYFVEVRHRNHHFVPLAVEQLWTVFQDLHFDRVFFGGIQNVAVAQQVHLEGAGLPSVLIQKLRFFMALASVPAFALF